MAHHDPQLANRFFALITRNWSDEEITGLEILADVAMVDDIAEG